MSAPDRRERDLVKCEDMRIHAERARQFLGTRSLEELIGDEMAQAAIIHCVEVIGEAARLVVHDHAKTISNIELSILNAQVTLAASFDIGH